MNVERLTLLEKKWKLVSHAENLSIEDDSIFTEDGEEVLGCSEWLRAGDGVLAHIVKLHNESLRTKRGKA